MFVLYSYSIVLLTTIRVDYRYMSANREKHVSHPPVQHCNFVRHPCLKIQREGEMLCWVGKIFSGEVQQKGFNNREVKNKIILTIHKDI